MALPHNLVTAVSARADDPIDFINMSRFAQFKRWPPASSEQVKRVELKLGVSIPAPLAELYREVANGGFGPGYGLLGIDDGAPDDRGNTADALYESFSVDDPDDPEWQWREGVIPFCYWGCAAYSCITQDGAVIGWDEGRWIDEPTDLATWLGAWIDGSLTQPS